MYLITQDLFSKLSNCESTYLEGVDDERDEMINNIGIGDFGSRFVLIGQEATYFVAGASIISCNRKSNGELY